MERHNLFAFAQFATFAALLTFGCSTDPAGDFTDGGDGGSTGDVAPLDSQNGDDDTTVVDSGSDDTGTPDDTGSGNGTDDTGTITPLDTNEPVRDASGPLGACCSSGRCSYAAQATCESKGHTSKPNKSCSSQPCSTTTGACCISGLSCRNTTLSECQDEGGTFKSAITCSEGPCSFSTGACCVENNTECFDSTEQNCPKNSATFHSNKNCADQPC